MPIDATTDPQPPAAGTGPLGLGESLAGAVGVVDGGLDLLRDLLVLADLDPQAARVDDPAVLKELLRALERVGRRVEACRVQVIGAAQRHRVPQRTGFTGAAPWVGRATRSEGKEAARQARLAEDLDQAQVTREAFQGGAVSGRHATVITQALADLPEGVDQDARRAVEEHLVRLAGEVDPGRLRKAARRALAAVEPDPVVVDAREDTVVTAEEDAAWQRASFAMWEDEGRGTMSGRFTVPRVQGAMLGKILDAMTAPRRMRDTPASTAGTSGKPGGRGTTPVQGGAGPQAATGSGPGSTGGGGSGAAGSAGAGESGGAGSGEVGQEWDWRSRRGRAFAELLEHLPTDHLSNKVAATLLISLDYDTLSQRVAAVARDDTGEAVSAGMVRKLACQAGIIPAVLGSGSVVLNQGSQTRLFTQAQRMALARKYTTCAAEGCDRPFAWCEIHHLDPWSTHHRTDLDVAVPLCGCHHHEVDRVDSSYTIRPGPGGTVIVSFHRRT